MRQSTADRVRALPAYASALLWAVATVLVFVVSAQDASAKNEFIRHKGGAPAPDGAQAICRTYSWACATTGSRSTPSDEELRFVAAVNAQVNRSVHAVEDNRQYGVAEYWALPTRTGGDCEDFALLKKRELMSLGVDPQRLLIATALDRRRNPHAVLVFRSAKGDLVLDNLTDRIRPWKDTGYVFLRMQDPDRPTRWVNVFASG